MAGSWSRALGSSNAKWPLAWDKPLCSWHYHEIFGHFLTFSDIFCLFLTFSDIFCHFLTFYVRVRVRVCVRACVPACACVRVFLTFSDIF